MKKMNKSMENHATNGLTGFELTKKVLNVSSQYEIKGVTLNVLIYLATCYNSKNKFVYPKQKTIAKVISASERSVVRAIQELVKKGLIIVECKYSNRYVFTSKLTGEPPQTEKIFTPENMSDDLYQNDSKKDDKISPHDKEQIKETNKTTNVEDYKILKAYAQKMGANNIHAYINKLISSGSAKNIIKEAKRTKANANAMLKLAQQVQKEAIYAKENRVENLTPEFFNTIREQLKRG